jgi:hypothetical protein
MEVGYITLPLVGDIVWLFGGLQYPVLLALAVGCTVYALRWGWSRVRRG